MDIKHEDKKFKFKFTDEEIKIINEKKEFTLDEKHSERIAMSFIDLGVRMKSKIAQQ
tara:strand:- start:2546 stop:2716 length:171 start_codon:yes stop_codon:yes gene_type:complete